MSISSFTCAGIADVSEGLGAEACAAGAVEGMPGNGGGKSGWDR